MRVWQVQAFDGREGSEVLTHATPAQALPYLVSRVEEMVGIYHTKVLWVDVSARDVSDKDFVLRVFNTSDSVELVGRYVQGADGSTDLNEEETAGLIAGMAALHRALRYKDFAASEGPDHVQFGTQWILRRP